MRMPLIAAALATALITVTLVFTSASAGTAMADQDEQTAYAFIDKERSTLKVDALPLQAAKRLLEIEADIVRTRVGRYSMANSNRQHIASIAIHQSPAGSTANVLKCGYGVMFTNTQRLLTTKISLRCIATAPINKRLPSVSMNTRMGGRC